jgi:hypothetical protein
LLALFPLLFGFFYFHVFVKCFACPAITLVKRSTNVIPHTKAEFGFIRAAAFGTPADAAVLTKVSFCRNFQEEDTDSRSIDH